MKKFFAIFLTMMLILSMSIAAFAEADEPSPSASTTFTFEKSYQTTAGATPATYPAETLKFVVTAVEGNPDNTMITIADHTVASNPGNVTVTVPTYSKTGKWNYTISEQQGSTQGVTYSENSFNVQVFVSYDTTNPNQLVAVTSFTSGTTGSKIDEIVNKYDLGTLTIDKNVTGNLASQTQKFDIDVTFTSDKPVLSAISGAADIAVSEWTLGADNKYTVTKTVSLAHGDSVATFSNIPAGVSYTVAEQSKHTEADANGSDISKGYTASYTNANGNIAADTTSAATVLNTKGTTVDTGITMDSLPYIMLIAFVAVIGAVMLIKRLKASND